MTKLEEEILFAMEMQESKDPRDLARMAGVVAKRYIEKAFYESPLLLAEEPNPEQEGIDQINACKEKWLKENGIT